MKLIMVVVGTAMACDKIAVGTGKCKSDADCCPKECCNGNDE